NASRHPELEAATSSLSIVTFRFVPEDVDRTAPGAEAYLNELNSDLLGEIQASGEAYLSNAVVGGRYLLRACIVNFRTAERDVDPLPEIVVRLGRRLHARKRAQPAGGPGGGTRAAPRPPRRPLPRARVAPGPRPARPQARPARRRAGLSHAGGPAPVTPLASVPAAPGPWPGSRPAMRASPCTRRSSPSAGSPRGLPRRRARSA